MQFRQPHSEGRAYFERKVAEGKTKREALRPLKRQLFHAIYRQLVLDAGYAAREDTGERRIAAWSALHPEGRLFGEVTPGPHKADAVAPSRDGSILRARKDPKLGS